MPSCVAVLLNVQKECLFLDGLAGLAVDCKAVEIAPAIIALVRQGSTTKYLCC